MAFKTLLGRAWQGLRKDRFLQILLLALAGLSLFSRTPLSSYPALVDWPTIAALTGLLALTQGVETSGALHRLGHWLVGYMTSERAAALCLVTAAAVLSTVLTNDVALFVVVPLTLGICRITPLPTTRLVVFEALAVNAGSALTPIGNPQNLFLWQLSGTSFAQFVWHMLPLVAVLMLLLWAVTALAFSGRPLQATDPDADHPLDRRLLVVSLLLYPVFLVLTDLHYAPWALLAVLLCLGAIRWRVLAHIDWGLLLVFVLMFIDLRLLVGLDAVQHALAGWGLAQPLHLFWAGIATSQIVSNVPAAIALAEFSKDWKVLAYAVNIGGFGLMVGSLANLIALRMAPDKRAWISFHVWSVPFLVAGAAVGWVLLFAM
ncbi:transporter, YbiR family [Rhodoferax sp. OV413]|uniref:SLC13 family permease n=1 Tax=Rhodoferax sp. OV413 TaxID=1855285 RepID=UPI000884149D|nr:SLC13 family permease [Rhodoferax sp. OV413]SDO74133.1 transporter, YbiR family [Rhodoferax sp. OV413]